jgi:uncharacterized protein YjbI with pentapeptide repeats
VTAQPSDRFPGPKPYEEDQHHLFFGREREVERMINATFERLGVLSAESGAGKSSLLAAGYIPELRRLRAAKRGVPPVLLLRAWGGRASEAEDRILAGVIEAVGQLPARSEMWTNRAPTLSDSALKKRAEDIASSIAADHQKLTGILGQFDFKKKPRGPSMTEVLGALSEEEGLILILDQFEEFMGSASAEAGGDQRNAERVTQAVGRLFRDVPKIRLLIALRTEYCRTLQRYLNFFVPNLDRRVIDLSPLPSKSIVQIVKGVSSNNTSEAEIKEFADKLAVASGATKGDESSNVSVLEVQALLNGYDAWCTTKRESSDFTLSLWDEYVDYLTEGLMQEAVVARSTFGGTRPKNVEVSVGRAALKLWVENQLKLAVGDSRSDDGQRERAQRARWMLLPVLPRLSTQGGYKQHLPLMQLCLDLADRLSDGWGKLDAVIRCVDAWLHNGGDSQLALEAIDLRELKQQGANDSRTAAERTQALETTRNLIRECIVEFRATIKSLKEKSILKMSGSGKDESCELVHDGLSEHVRKWAEDLPKSPQTLLGSPVDVVGERFSWRELGGRERSTISDQHWIGCSLKGATISNVTFDDCEFRGLSLTECILDNVVFRRCRMPGAIMIGCTLTGVRFENCNLLSAAFIKCSFTEKIEFKGTLPKLDPQPKLGDEFEREKKDEIMNNMTGADFAGCTMQPRALMEFNQCLLRFAKIGKLNFKGGNRVDFVKCDMMNAWVEDAGMPSVGVDQYCRTIGLLSFVQPPEGWLDRNM